MKIDINADIGEGYNNDKNLFPLISSCNIACGGHAGDNESIKNSIILAINHNVKIGAHPSFPDKLNFGRKLIKISEKYFRPLEVNELLGDSTKAKKILNWSPKINFDSLINEIVDFDCKK